MRTPAESASYDSLQARLDRRFAGGLLVRTSYTWSKSMNAADSSGGNVQWNGSSDYYRNRALAGHDRTHNLRVAWIWDLPFGRGNRWATSGVAAQVLGGWKLSGIFSSYSGTPFTVTASATSLNAAGETQTADQIKAEVEKLGAIGTTTPFFDPLAFAAITTARFGNSGRNLLRGPGLVNLDATIARTFRLTEGLDLEFRTECYNVSNTPAFNNPSTNVSNMTVSNGVITNLGGFMTVTSARQRAGSLEGGERAFRFGLRLVF
jgi:hypothetical protein